MSVRHAVLLYDGACIFCNRLVQFLIRRDREGSLRYAPLQGRYGQAALKRHAELQGIDSIVFLETSPRDGVEHAFVRSDAVLRLAAYFGGPWRILLLARLIPRPLRDLLYDAFARRRYAIFGNRNQCVVPPAHIRSRFFE
jgi:predicted DCC family thiol-disulfide oxidoreductase YuxK